MSTVAPDRTRRRMTAVLREEETITPLELFFDLVFVLALTQCTALMAAEPTWEGSRRARAVPWPDLRHVCFRLRNIHTLSSRRLGLAIVLLAFIPLAYELKLPALGTVAILAASLVALIVSETHVYGEARTRVRSELRHQHQPNGETT